VIRCGVPAAGAGIPLNTRPWVFIVRNSESSRVYKRLPDLGWRIGGGRVGFSFRMGLDSRIKVVRGSTDGRTDECAL
jgi:hypothetical protein